MLVALCAYDVLLIVAILFLQWHYLVDILGGVLVAGLAIVITDGSNLQNLWSRPAPDAHLPEGTLFA
jgi:hypothetical protein